MLRQIIKRYVENMSFKCKLFILFSGMEGVRSVSIYMMYLGGNEVWSLRIEQHPGCVASSFYLFPEHDLNHAGKLKHTDKVQTSYAKLCPCGVNVRNHATLLGKG